MDWIRYLRDKEDFLNSTFKGFRCVRGTGPTLWDLLWSEYHDTHGGGKLGDYIEAEYKYLADQAREGGDSRDSFLDWLGYCGECGRGKKLDPAREEEQREEYARASIDDDLGCFYKGETERAKHRRSQYLVPSRFDWIEDPDDDIGVAIALNIAELTPKQKARLSRLSKQKERKQITVEPARQYSSKKARVLDEHEFWLRIYTAQWLIGQLDEFTTQKDESPIETGKVQYLCGCHYPLDPSEEEPEPAEVPCFGPQLICPKCGEPSCMREAQARAAAILDWPGGYWLYTKAGKEQIHTNTPPLPFESDQDPLANFVTRLEPMQHRKLLRRFKELCESDENWSIADYSKKFEQGVSVVYYPETTHGLHDLHEAVSMTVYIDGFVRIGPSYCRYTQGSDEKRFFPTEEDILFARAALFRAGFREVTEEVRAYG